jgi:hypothetical protein
MNKSVKLNNFNKMTTNNNNPFSSSIFTESMFLQFGVCVQTSMPMSGGDITDTFKKADSTEIDSFDLDQTLLMLTCDEGKKPLPMKQK